MAYRTEQTKGGGQSLVIDGFEKGIANSPYFGIANIRNVNTAYYPGVAYVNYRRRASSLTGNGWFAGANSVDVSNNEGWIFSGLTSSTMSNPLHKAQSPSGLIYILDDIGQIWKQTAVNSTSFAELEGGSGRMGEGHGGLAYWNNYLVVFGDGYIEFCGDGSGDSAITSSNWNLNTAGNAHNTATFTVGSPTTEIDLDFPYYTRFFPHLQVGDQVTFSSTGTLPAPLVAGTIYYVESFVSSTVIQVSATVGGSAISFTTDGTGTHTMTDVVYPAPIGNCTNLTFTGTITVGSTTLTIDSYVDPSGTTVQDAWFEASGNWSIVIPDGTRILATFTTGSPTITLLAPLVYLTPSTEGEVDVEIINSTATTYKTWVSKADGNLYFANGNNLGRILAQNENIQFNPGLYITYVVNYAVTELLLPGDTIVDMTDLKSQMVIAGQRDVYTWDYVSSNVSSPGPVGEQIIAIENLLNNIYILAGTKGNLYISNGYSAQLFYKIPDYISGVIDPVIKWGGLMVHRSKLFFQALIQNSSGTNILAGIFSLLVSPQPTDPSPNALVMEAQNSYGLTPASGAVQTGVLISNEQWSTGIDSYYSGWSNGASTGGIDYNDSSLWQNYEPVIETDIIPIGTILDKKTFGNIEFKLDRPLANGDAIRLSWRPSLSDSYSAIGTTTATATDFLQVSNYFTSNISQAQWAQFKVEFKGASSSSSFIPLREIRLYFN